jgi:hypothetical protein
VVDKAKLAVAQATGALKEAFTGVGVG